MTNKPSTLPGALLLIILQVALIFFSSFVSLQLYDWHILSNFSGFPVLSYWQMFGISIFIGYYFHAFSNRQSRDGEDAWETLFIYAARIFTYYGLGYLAYILA